MFHFPGKPDPPSANELLEADDDTAESLVVAYVDELLRQSPLDQLAAFSRLSRGMQFIYSTAILEGEVETGGFNQYFFSMSSDYSLEALHGYRSIGAIEHARLLRRALHVFHRERWFHFRIKLRRSLDAFFDSYEHTGLSQIDHDFCESDEDCIALRAGYIRANLAQFSR